MLKNVATKIAMFAFDITTGAAKTGDSANITAWLSKDFGAVAQLGDTSAAELDATNAKGWYLFDVAQTESNADTLLFTGKSTTANISIVGQVIFTAGDLTATMKASVTAAVNDTVIEGSLTFKQIIKLMLSILAGKASGGGTTTVTFRDTGDTKNRIVATVDASGNRTGMTLDGT